MIPSTGAIEIVEIVANEIEVIIACTRSSHVSLIKTPAGIKLNGRKIREVDSIRIVFINVWGMPRRVAESTKRKYGICINRAWITLVLMYTFRLVVKCQSFRGPV
jgi:hypothetical protein